MKLNRSLAHQISLAIFAIILTTGCGAQKDAGLAIALAVSPDKAYVVPGKGVSCVAAATAKKDGSVPVADVTGDRIAFSRFVLQWKSGDRLTISSITSTIFSSGIDGADSVDGLPFTMDENEMTAMLGLDGLTVPFDATVPFNKDRITSIDSTSTALKSGSTPYAPCGFQIGSLASKKTSKTYSARIKIEVSGFRTACELDKLGVCQPGEQTPVRQSVTVSAQKY